MTATRPQAMKALDRANEIRTARARLKKRVTLGIDTVPRVLLEQPEWAQRMEIEQLLLAQRGKGKAKVGAFLRRQQISPYVQLRNLTPRQVAMIVEWCE